MSASRAMRSNSARLYQSVIVSCPKSMKAAWMSCGGTAVPIRLSQACVTGGPFCFAIDVGSWEHVPRGPYAQGCRHDCYQGVQVIGRWLRHRPWGGWHDHGWHLPDIAETVL